MTEKDPRSIDLPWNLDFVTHAGPELSSKALAAVVLYGFLRSKGRWSLSALLSAVEEFRHAAADNNPQGGEMCGRFDLMEQLLGASYFPHGSRTPEEEIKIARASWPFMSELDKAYERQALHKLKKK